MKSFTFFSPSVGRHGPSQIFGNHVTVIVRKQVRCFVGNIGNTVTKPYTEPIEFDGAEIVFTNTLRLFQVTFGFCFVSNGP